MDYIYLSIFCELAGTLSLIILYAYLYIMYHESYAETFVYNLKMPDTGLFVAGYAFILWGTLTICMPYALNVEWSTPWCYLIGGILKLMIASGTLMVYLDKTRINLDKKENQYRLLAENAADVLFHYNLPEAKFEYISPSVLPVTGYKPEDYYADTKLLANLIDSNDLPMFNSLINNPSSADDLTLTFRLIRKDQSMIWMEQKCVPIYDKAGKLVAQVGILRDITTRKNLEQIAARADRINMVGKMASNVAHEIRNPLTTVRGYLQMMTKNKELDHYKKRFELIIAELDRTNTIISEYLLLAKDKRSDLKNCCLNTIIKTLLPIIETDALVSNVYINLNLTDIPQLYLDETEIRQLLLNLVRNGLEAMPPGGKLTICTYLEYNNVVLSIQDQGTGLPTHVLDNLGTPFLTTKDTGTGLGLPICYRIATRHNAAISIKTDEQGTIFFVYFKLSCLVA